MSPTERFFAGRRFHPAGLTLLLAALLVAGTLLPVLVDFHLLYHPYAAGSSWLVHGTGAWALATAVVFAVGWYRNSDKLIDLGFQLSTIMWLSVACVGWTTGTDPDRILFSLCFAVLSAGSAWLEGSEGGSG